MVDQSNVEQRVIDLIAEQLQVSASEVTPEAYFTADLGADSLDLVEIVMAFEDKFGIDIPEEDAESMQTVGDAIKYLQARL